MIWQKILLSILFFCNSLNVQAAQHAIKKLVIKSDILCAFNYTTLSSLINACLSKQTHKNIISHEELKKALSAYDTLSLNQFSNQQLWINPEQMPEAHTTFKPFVQKLVLPENAQVAMWGDLHGDKDSLLRCMQYLQESGYLNNQFQIIKPNFYMFFLGDFVDRGDFGVEVVYTLIRLKLANPDRVHLVRGNHEDCGINEGYGFFAELEKKFDTNASKLKEKCAQFYEQLPVAIFLGYGDSSNKVTDYALCCHGGIEPGFNPKNLLESQGDVRLAWLGTLHRAQWLDKIAQTEVCKRIKSVIPDSELQNSKPQKATGRCQHVGFMWHDFIVDDGQKLIEYTPGRGWAFGRELTEDYCDNAWLENSHYKISKIFRAHQHWGPMLKKLLANKGIATLWNEKVYTLFSAPGVGYGNFPDSFIIVTANQNWKVKHINL